MHYKKQRIKNEELFPSKEIEGLSKADAALHTITATLIEQYEAIEKLRPSIATLTKSYMVFRTRHSSTVKHLNGLFVGLARLMWLYDRQIILFPRKDTKIEPDRWEESYHYNTDPKALYSAPAQ